MQIIFRKVENKTQMSTEDSKKIHDFDLTELFYHNSTKLYIIKLFCKSKHLLTFVIFIKLTHNNILQKSIYFWSR